MKRFKAFTLHELLIAMIVISLVITAGFASLRFFNNVFRLGSVSVSEAQQLSLGLQQLNRDAFSCKHVILNDDNSIQMGRVKYDVLGDKLLRNTIDNTDTIFSITKLTPKKFLFSDTILSGLQIEFKSDQGERNFWITKQYDAETKMIAGQDGNN